MLPETEVHRRIKGRLNRISLHEPSELDRNPEMGGKSTSRRRGSAFHEPKSEMSVLVIPRILTADCLAGVLSKTKNEMVSLPFVDCEFSGLISFTRRRRSDSVFMGALLRCAQNVFRAVESFLASSQLPA
jgi:hypothetical protein